jgi:hypothetical protein
MRTRISPVGLVFLALHTVALSVIASQSFEGSWGGFFIYILDMPVSFIYLPLVNSQQEQWLVSALVGGAWWYVIGIVLGRLASWASAALKGAAAR